MVLLSSMVSSGSTKAVLRLSLSPCNIPLRFVSVLQRYGYNPSAIHKTFFYLGGGLVLLSLATIFSNRRRSSFPVSGTMPCVSFQFCGKAFVFTVPYSSSTSPIISAMTFHNKYLFNYFLPMPGAVFSFFIKPAEYFLQAFASFPDFCRSFQHGAGNGEQF